MFSCERDYSSVGFELGPPGSFNYIAYDSLGTPIVRGWLRFEFTDSVRFEGSWKMKELDTHKDLCHQVGEGELLGIIHNSSVSIELNPQFRDHNLHLSGTIDGIHIEGKWFFITFIGITNWGTFKAVKN